MTKVVVQYESVELSRGHALIQIAYIFKIVGKYAFFLRRERLVSGIVTGWMNAMCTRVLHDRDSKDVSIPGEVVERVFSETTAREIL